MNRTVIGKHEVNDQGVVLCHLPDNPVTPFATWRYYVPQGMSSTSWGYYAKTREEAEKDFHERCARVASLYGVRY